MAIRASNATTTSPRPAVRNVLALCLAVGIVGQPLPSHAQDRPVVFVHGLASSGDTWLGAASRLQAALTLKAETPTTNWRALYESQANQLQQQLGGLGGNTVGIGHSNGGLVTRQWSRMHPLSAVVTVGSPHSGAPLVRNLYWYAGFNDGLLGSINAVFRLFGQGCCQWQWMVSAYATLWQLAAQTAASSFGQIAGAVAVNGSVPVTPEMIPGSAFLTSLNSQANLVREASAIPLRAGVASTAYNFYWGGPLRAAFPDSADQLAYWRDAARAGMYAYAAYIYANAAYEDWWAFEIASGMINAAGFLTYMDEWWCETVSVSGGGACWANDTIVPQWSQVYPNGLFIDTGWNGPAHTQETRMSDALLQQILVNYAGVPPRTAAPQPGAGDAVFYGDIDFGGGSFATASDLAFVGWDWNDRMSSVHVPPGRTVVLYEHADFGGESLTLTADDADLRQYAGPGVDGTWNDAASAVRVF
jgi:pimeloyl-ACP methyl ester carboxylesterase